MSFSQRTESVLIDGIRYPTDRPHLSVMGVAGKLEINSIVFCFFQMIGLMVELYEKTGLVYPHA